MNDSIFGRFGQTNGLPDAMRAGLEARPHEGVLPPRRFTGLTNPLRLPHHQPCAILAGMSFLFPLHPRFVHFPIALLVTGSLLALAYLWRWPRPGLASLAWGNLLLGWLALFPAVLAGLIDQNQAPQNEAVLATLNPHIAVGFGLIVVYGLLLYERLRRPDALEGGSPRLRLLLLLLLGLILVVAEGALGGQLVYKFGLGVM